MLYFFHFAGVLGVCELLQLDLKLSFSCPSCFQFLGRRGPWPW